MISSRFALALLLGLAYAGAPSQEPDPEGAKLGIWSPKIEASWWQSNTEPEPWLELVGAMNITLREAHDRHGLEKMVINPHWLGWMLHTRWLSLLPDDWAENSFYRSEEGRQIFIQLGSSHRIRNRFFAALSPDDDQKKAAEILCRIAASESEAFHEYTNLAIAFAVVYDQPLPKGWPHGYVEHAKIPIGDSDPVERFRFLVRCAREGKLVHDLDRLRVQDLKFLVDTPLEFAELEYAQQIKLSSPSRLADLYTALPYANTRISSQQYSWPGDEYRLFHIGQEGGICMDLAYFVSHSGKALGVPTMLFVGQGLSGEHAWVGFLNSNGTWKLDAARFRNEEYPIGQAYDPQTWQRITDSEIAALQRGSRLESDRLTKGQALLQWAALNRSDDRYPEILRLSRRAGSNDTRPWQLEADWLEENEEDPAVLSRFWGEWVSNFSKNKDLEVAGQMRLVALYEEHGKEDEAERLRRLIMSSNRSKRFDLGIAIAAEPVFRKLRKRQFAEAEEAFDQAIRRYHAQAGGFLFYNLIEPYVRTCIQEGQTAMAQGVIRTLDRNFAATTGSILDQDIAAMRERIEALL
ncbi:MAG: hypothetical protein AAF236_04770 [Verrucomicrobiota bacterium]